MVDLTKLPLSRVLEMTAEELTEGQVDCGTCPLNMRCAVGDGGNGWTFRCCGATGVEVVGEHGEELLFIVDCVRHGFARGHYKGTVDLATCPLCNGDIVKTVAIGASATQRYLPTVHSKVSLAKRVKTWQALKPAAEELRQRIEKTRQK